MFSKLVRLGKDAELATTPNGKQVCKIVAAYDVGYGDNKRTVWIDGALWGDRGAKLAQYLTKGVQIVIHGDDLEPDAFQGKNGLQTKLKMTINNIELISRQNDAPKPVPQYPSANSSPNQILPNAADFDSDIPF